MGGGASKQGFQNGTPEFEYDSVVKCFKNDGNGLLFRLTNKESLQWAFYNDTKNKEFHIRVTFHGDATIQPLGNTVLEQGGPWEDNGVDAMADDDAKPTYVATLVVYPLQTELFIEGTVNGFKALYDVDKVSKEGKAYVKQKEQEKKNRAAAGAGRGDEDAASQSRGDGDLNWQVEDAREEDETKSAVQAEEEVHKPNPQRRSAGKRAQPKEEEMEVTEVQAF